MAQTEKSPVGVSDRRVGFQREERRTPIKGTKFVLLEIILSGGKVLPLNKVTTNIRDLAIQDRQYHDWGFDTCYRIDYEDEDRRGRVVDSYYLVTKDGGLRQKGQVSHWEADLDANGGIGGSGGQTGVGHIAVGEKGHQLVLGKVILG